MSIKKEPRYVETRKEKEENYLEKISVIDASQIVYIDESGVEQNCYKARDWGKIGQVLESWQEE